MQQRKPKLGEVLLRSGAIDEAQLRDALRVQEQWSGRKLGSILVDKGVLPEKVLTRVLTRLLGFQAVDLDAFRSVDRSILDRVDPRYAATHKLFPFEFRAPNVLRIAMSDPSDLKTVSDLEFKTGCRIEAVLCGEKEISRAITNHYHSQSLEDTQVDGGDEVFEVLDAQGRPLNQGDSAPDHTAVGPGGPQTLRGAQRLPEAAMRPVSHGGGQRRGTLPPSGEHPAAQPQQRRSTGEMPAQRGMPRRQSGEYAAPTPQQIQQQRRPSGEYTAPGGQARRPSGEHPAPPAQGRRPSGEHPSPAVQARRPSGEYTAPAPGSPRSPSGEHPAARPAPASNGRPGITQQELRAVADEIKLILGVFEEEQRSLRQCVEVLVGMLDDAGLFAHDEFERRLKQLNTPEAEGEEQEPLDPRDMTQPHSIG